MMTILCVNRMRIFSSPIVFRTHLPIANCQLPIAHCLLSIAHCLLSICFIPFIASGQGTACDWQEFSLGEPKLSMILPAKAVPMEVQVPFDMINHIRRFDTYRLYFAEGKVLAVFKFAQYNIPIAANPGDVLKEELSKLMSGMKAMNVRQEEKEIKLQSFQGFKIHGSFELNQKNWLFEDHLFLSDGSMWQVWIAVESGDMEREDMMRKMIKSFRFKS